jgi:hypothetical protein
LSSFDSTNKAQQKAFQEALIAMAEMRPWWCTCLWFSVAKMIVKWEIHIAAIC